MVASTALATCAQASMQPIHPGPCSLDDQDDKYKKAPKVCESLSTSKLCEISTKDVKTLLQSPLQVYLSFLMVCSVIYYCLGGNLMKANILDYIGVISIIAEGFGLLWVRLKIKRQGSVTGISGMTMIMYAIVYFLREWLLLPASLSLHFVDQWMTEVLQLASLYMVLDVLKSIFWTYRSSYQEDLDVFKVTYLIPACILLAVPLHPQFRQGSSYSICWTAYLYLDCLALMPQVVMMARGNGRVEAPISHFVAATALSRLVDLAFWYYDFGIFYPQGHFHGFNYSGWLIVLWHVISLLIVADFIYYYVKARLSGSTLSEDLALPTEEDIC